MQNEFLLKKLDEIAYRMNREGTQVHEGLYQTALKSLPPEKAPHFLDCLHDGSVYGKWTVSESDLFWRCQGPNLMQLPMSAQRSIVGVKVECTQSLVFLAAKEGGASDWLEHYVLGGDLYEFAARKLDMGRDEAKRAFLRYAFGAVDCPTTWQVEATFPWLAHLVESFEHKALSGEEIYTNFGTQLGSTLFPRSTFGRYLTQTSKDVVRLGVLHLYVEYNIVPKLILPNSVVVPSGHEHLVRTWGKHGFQVAVDRF